MCSHFIGGKQRERVYDLYDGTFFRAHYAAKLLECYGFAEVDVGSQDWNHLCLGDDGTIVLTDAYPEDPSCNIATIFPFMSRLACADAELFMPLFEACDKREIRSEVEFFETNVEPGRYRVCVRYGQNLFPTQIKSEALGARVKIIRLGEAHPRSSAAEVLDRVKRFIEVHPWLLQEHMRKRYEKRQDTKDY